MSAELIEEVFLPIYGNKILNRLDDSAQLNIENKRIAFTTDSYTIKPIFFPDADIGKLAVCGTVNDLSAKAAKPIAISVGFIIEEGFLMEDLKKIASSIANTASSVGLQVAAGDTKIVGRGEADGIFINTSGIGVIFEGMNVSCRNAKEGDDIIISGSIAEHGIAILNARQNLGFSPQIKSDAAPVFDIVKRIAKFGRSIHAMRDPTRGGLASVLNEIARASRVNIIISQEKVPIKQPVRSCCDLLGMDPLYLANEGKIVLFVDPKKSADVLREIRKSAVGIDAVVIGEVEKTTYSGLVPPVSIMTQIASRRFCPPLEGESLPRIC